MMIIPGRISVAEIIGAPRVLESPAARLQEATTPPGPDLLTVG
jgi:hypothetical protein